MIKKLKSKKKKPYLTTTDGVDKTGNDTVFCLGVLLTTGQHAPYRESTRYLGRGNQAEKKCYSTRELAQKEADRLNQEKSGREAGEK